MHPLLNQENFNIHAIQCICNEDNSNKLKEKSQHRFCNFFSWTALMICETPAMFTLRALVPYCDLCSDLFFFCIAAHIVVLKMANIRFPV